MKKEIFEGTTIEEAKEKAMKDLNLKEEDLIIKELTKNNTEKKVIEVTKKEDLTDFIKELLIDIISDMGINCNIEVKQRDDLYYLNILSNKNEILIGKSGRILDAIQTIVNQVIKTNLNM